MGRRSARGPIEPDVTAPEATRPVTKLEHLMDSAPWRALERGVERGRTLRRRWRQRRAADRSPPKGPAPEQRLERALRRSAFGEAEAIADALEDALPSLPEARRPAVAAAVLDWLFVSGQTERARALAARHRDALLAHPRGHAALDALGLRDTPSVWLPDGKPNFYGLAAGLARGTVDGEALVASLARRPDAFLRHPQLHLLAYLAHRVEAPAAAERSLNRFLRVHRLSPCRLGAGGSFLAGLRCEPGPPVHDGPLVSVVMSAFDAEDTVAYAVDSLLAQTYRRLEVLVCDDASRDGTRALLERRYGDEPRVRLFASEANQGTYNARNALLARARGELLTFQDADDLALPERIARQVRALRDADACATRWIRVSEDGRVVFFRDQNAVRLCVVSLMMRRRVYDAVGPYRPARFGADLEVFETVRARFGVRRLRAPLLLGLWAERSLTRTSGAEALEDGYRAPSRRVYAELLGRAVATGSPEARAELDEAVRASGNRAEPRPIVALD
ncbi:MAG TPA: glycosyltransferase family A protein [Sandaracinaceae bacterium LLY-WYZ-13_1]|nr:glycosyltransferase family A protein [Sandaracinaceae bacterium LLY-WYZ-13_1]